MLRPWLPTWLDQIRLENLRVGEATLDLRVHRLPDGGHGLDIERQDGELEVALDEV